MESDERFKHLALDPRFKNLRKKQRKVQIDDRFKSMFTDEKFTLKYSRDKRGRKQKKTSGDDLKRYYSMEDDDSSEIKQDKSKISDKKVVEKQQKQGGFLLEQVTGKEDRGLDEIESDDSDKQDEELEEKIDEGEIDAQDSDVGDKSELESGSELSSSSDEAESDDERENELDEIDVDKIEYDWKPLDHDAETAETTTKRLAIQNLDWDRLDVKDIYTLVNSIRPPITVKIYISEFGKERLKNELLEGPKEIVEMTKVDEVEEEYNLLRGKMVALMNPGSKAFKVNEYEDADEEMDPKNEEVRERIRRYQLSKMKYYYAVAEFDSIESAEVVYKELDGMEYEGSALELDLRFIPDDIEFNPEDVKAGCDKSPDLTSYRAPQFINSALQQTTVKFTWDETDVKRQEKLQRAYTKHELDKDDLDAYLASGTDSSDEDASTDTGGERSDCESVVTTNSSARINKYKMLLKKLDEETEKKKKVDVDIEWGNYSEDEERLAGETGVWEDEDEDEDEGDEDEVNDDDEELDYVGEHNEDDDENEISDAGREAKRGKKSRPGKRKQRQEQQQDEDDELDLLVMDADGRERDEFKFDPEDDRFKAVYDSGLYNIDPSHPNFKRTKAFDMIAEKKRDKRRKTSS